MFCGECGTQNPDTNQFCKNCGKPLRKPHQAPPAQPVAAQPTAQKGYYPPQPAVVLPQGAVAGAPVKPPLNKAMLALGILGIVIGIVSFFFYPYVLGITAVFLGGITFLLSDNKKGIIAVLAILAIATGIISMLVDHFYFVLFPVPAEFSFIYWMLP
jgi:hypothetical protein